MSRRRSAAGGSASLPLLPRLGECRAPPSATPFKDTLAPPSPPSSQWERPQCSPSANDRAPPAILPGPASNSCAGLVTRPPLPNPRAAPPGGAGWCCRARPRRLSRGSGTGLRGPLALPSGTLAPPSGTPASPSGTPGTAGSLLPTPAAAGPQTPSPTRPSARDSPCSGRRARSGAEGASCTAVGRERKSSRSVWGTRSSDPYRAGERV